MIQGAFVREDRARALGAWSGLGSIAAALGPFVGGSLVPFASWRWIFLVNLPAAATVLVARRWVLETRDPGAPPRFDPAGALLAALALGGTTYALVEWGTRPAPYAAVGAALAVAGVLVTERRSAHPMVPLAIFADRTFAAADVVTLLVHAALGAVLFFLVLELQTVGGYGALAAGLATLPLTACMLLLAPRGGALAARIGPRIPLTLGPLVVAGGTLLLLRAGALLAVAALPLAVGLRGAQYADAVALDAAYRSALLACAALLVAGGLVAAFTVRTRLS